MSGQHKGWFSVRCIFCAAQEAATTYEERITLWCADGFDDAIALAEADAQEYAQTTTVEYLGLAQAYHIGEQPRHGDEVYSLLRDSALDPTRYLNSFFDTGSERQEDGEHSALSGG